MKIPLRCLLLLAVVPAPCAPAANLILNGDFSDVTYTGSKPLTTLFGEFGTGSTNNTLTVANWSTSGYNYVYAPNTADSGTSTGANASQPNEAPGQYNTSAGYGNTYLWGADNGGMNTIPATDPAGNNFLAADGAFEVGAISQVVNTLSVGQIYAVSFYWAAAQQAGTNFTADTTENWTVNLGSQSFTTSTYQLPSKSFSGWMQQTFYYTATSTSETLSFLAGGTPTGQPPFVLLGGVSLDVAPEPSSWLLCVGLGAACVAGGMIRRRLSLPRL